VTNDRVAGADRFGTAAAACTEAYEDGTGTVIIATARNFPDALAASGLAGANDACILLVEVDSVPSGTVAAIDDRRLDISNLSPAVRQQLDGVRKQIRGK
jgi:putative cell wall-binding protein